MIASEIPLALNNYPIFEEAYRPILNGYIEQYFYMREIGFETPAEFNRHLALRMSLIMPYANRLYGISLDKILTLENVDIQETHGRTGKNSGISTVQQNQQSTSKGVSSDLPQQLVQWSEIQEDVYASEASISNSSGNADASQNSNSNFEESLNINRLGRDGGKYPIEVFQMLYSSFYSTDQWVLEQLEPLFIQLF